MLDEKKRIDKQKMMIQAIYNNGGTIDEDIEDSNEPVPGIDFPAGLGSVTGFMGKGG